MDGSFLSSIITFCMLVRVPCALFMCVCVYSMSVPGNECGRIAASESFRHRRGRCTYRFRSERLLRVLKGSVRAATVAASAAATGLAQAAF